jgi:hypothetical protein
MCIFINFFFNIYIYIYTYICISMYMYLYIYVHIHITFKSENLDKAEDGNEKKKARIQTSIGTSSKVSESIGI